MFIVLDVKDDYECTVCKGPEGVKKFHSAIEADAHGQKHCDTYRIVPLHTPTVVHIAVSKGQVQSVRSDQVLQINIVELEEPSKQKQEFWQGLGKSTLEVYKKSY